MGGMHFMLDAVTLLCDSYCLAELQFAFQKILTVMAVNLDPSTRSPSRRQLAFRLSHQESRLSHTF